VDRRELAYRFMYGRVLDVGCGMVYMTAGGLSVIGGERRS
jgi:hypothetical protein